MEFQGEFRFLSNFYPAVVEYAGIEFPSTENAYQASKCANPDERIEFKFLTAGQAKRLGQKKET